MHRVNESSIIDGSNSNEHVIYLLYQSEWSRVTLFFSSTERNEEKNEHFTHEWREPLHFNYLTWSCCLSILVSFSFCSPQNSLRRYWQWLKSNSFYVWMNERAIHTHTPLCIFINTRRRKKNRQIMVRITCANLGTKWFFTAFYFRLGTISLVCNHKIFDHWKNLFEIDQIYFLGYFSPYSNWFRLNRLENRARLTPINLKWKFQLAWGDPELWIAHSSDNSFSLYFRKQFSKGRAREREGERCRGNVFFCFFFVVVVFRFHSTFQVYCCLVCC